MYRCYTKKMFYFCIEIIPIMKKRIEPDIRNITPDILQDMFDTDTIENQFIIFDDLKNVIFQDGKIHEEACNYPFKSKEALIAFCTDGKLKAKVGVKNVEMGKQNMFVILPKQVFVITEISPDFKAIVVAVKESFFDFRNNLSEIKELQQFLLKEPGFFIPEQNMQEFLTLFGLVKMKLANPNDFTPKIIQHYCHIMFYNCYALVRQQETGQKIADTEKKEAIFERFINEVERHFKEQHDVGFYADRLCLTPKYLSLLIKAASGKTAADWIREYLVLETRALLKSGRMTVQQDLTN